MPLAAVTEEAIQRFQADGAVCLRGVFSREWIQKVAAGIEKNLARSSQYSERLQAPGGTGYFFNDYFNWREIEEFKDYVYNSPAAEIAGTLMQSPVAVFYHEHVLTKDPHTLKATPWHHDQAYYPVDGFKNCSIWMPIDAVPAETTLKFVKGSHGWGRWFHPKKFKSEKNYPVNDDAGTRLAETRVYENVPDIDGSDEYEILQWPIEPGDCVVFHMMTLHAANANISETLHRRVLSTRWLGDDCVLAERPWTPSPPILGGLSPGQYLGESETFPTVWRAG